MNQTGKKLGRNERCHCGSGKKYKHCHLDTDQRSRGAAVGAPPNPEFSPDSAATTQLPGLLKELSRTGPAKDRAVFADLQSTAGPLLAYLEKEEEIEAASTLLEAHRAAFDELLGDFQAYLDRSSALFAEDRFAPLRFTAADIRRAFDQVGYPKIAAPNDQMLESLRAAILYLADNDRRRNSSMSLLLHLPGLVADGRYLDAWLIQHSAHQTAEFNDESNPFLFAMFGHGYDAWTIEKRAQDQLALQQLGLAPERLSDMGLDEIDAWIKAQEADPARRAGLAAFIEANPDVRSEAIANLEAMEHGSVKLLERPDARVLLLSPTEAGPWLPELSRRLENVQDKLPKKPDAPMPPAIASQVFDEAILPLLREMAQSIFTPARIRQLLAQLKKYRSEQFAAGDQAIAGCAMGAMTSLERENDPGQNYFLVALCLSSLRPAMGL